MIARIAAAALVVSMGLGAQPVANRSEDLKPATVGVTLTFDGKPSRGFVKSLRQEVASLFRPTGLDLRWQILERGTKPGVYDRAVVLRMKGRCNASAVYDATREPQARRTLGETIISDGEVLPIVVVNCDEIARAVSDLRFQAVGPLALPNVHLRLTARVVAHELLHALLKNPDHQETDCAKALLRPADLLSVARLSAGEVAELQKIGRPSSVGILAER